MKYALLNYSKGGAAGERGARDMHPGIAAVLDRPNVSGWVRLQPAESATTVTLKARTTLLTDGPFVDSKEFLGGFIMIEADNLDEALAVAAELQELDATAAIEVRPVFEQELGGA
ncbi:MAG: YCII-related protein [Solirubrobacterales bacterium]|nr:YCII-related protein [Solirubrobacterales bacterium]